MSKPNEPAFPNQGDGSRWDGMTYRQVMVGQVATEAFGYWQYNEGNLNDVVDDVIKLADAIIAREAETAGGGG